MKSKQLFTKMLLVALCLIGGSGFAWADAENVFTQNFTKDGDKTAVTDYGFTVITENNSSPKMEFTDSNGKLVLVSGGNQGSDVSASAKASFTAVEGDYNVNFSCTWATGEATGTRGYSRLILANADGNVALQLDYYGGDKKIQVNGSDAATSVNRSQTFAVTATLNLQTQKITALQIGSAYTQVGSIAFKEATATTISTLQFTANNKASWTNTTSIDDIVITKEEITTAAIYSTVTYKYEDTSGNSLSAYHADVQNSEEVGTTISALITGDVIATFYNGTSNKYVYANSYTVTGDYTTVQSTGNTVTLKFTDYPATAYNVEAQVGGNDLTSLASGTAYFDGSTTEYWHKFIKYNDQWYETNSTSYYAAITTETTNVAYTANNDIDYYYDENDMTRVGSLHASYTKDFMSQGDGVRLAANTTLYTEALTAGIYKVTIAASSYSGTPFIEFGYRLSDTNNKLGQTGTWSNTTTAATQEFTVAIPEDASFCIFTGDGYSNLILDYVTLKKLPDNVSKNITSAGWATYCSPYALDFSEVAGLTAYIVTGGADGKLTKSVVTSVPAGTGVLLKGAVGDYTIPVAASSATDVTGNKLTGVTTQTQIDANAGYVLMNGSEGVAFYKNAHAFNVGANTAYLPANFATNAARAFFSFGDDATDIRLIENGKIENSVYDLQGRRVSQPTKGLYIKDGKVVVVK